MLCKAILELSNPMKPEGILNNSKIPKEQKKTFKTLKFKGNLKINNES